MSEEAGRQFVLAKEARDFEIGLFWRRSLFFWGFIGAAFVAYGELSKPDAENPIALVLVCCFGFVCSIAWTLVNRGSKFWQQVWEERLADAEERLGLPLYSAPATVSRARFWGAPFHSHRFSVTRLATALSDFTAVVWFILALKAALGDGLISCTCLTVPQIAVGATVIYAVVMGVRSLSKS